MRFHATLYSLVVSQPHKATFAILKRMLQKAMEVLTREKTVPMIVRRLKTVCNADQILVLDRRKIVQGGTHDTLVTQRGIYRNFVIERTVSDCWTLRESEMDREQGRQMKQCTHFCVHRFSCIFCLRGAALFFSLTQLLHKAKIQQHGHQGSQCLSHRKSCPNTI